MPDTRSVRRKEGRAITVLAARPVAWALERLMTTKTMDRKGETGRHKRNDREGNKGVWTLKPVRSVVVEKGGSCSWREGGLNVPPMHRERERERRRLTGRVRQS